MRPMLAYPSKSRDAIASPFSFLPSNVIVCVASLLFTAIVVSSVTLFPSRKCNRRSFCAMDGFVGSNVDGDTYSHVSTTSYVAPRANASRFAPSKGSADVAEPLEGSNRMTPGNGRSYVNWTRAAFTAAHGTRVVVSLASLVMVIVLPNDSDAAPGVTCPLVIE